MFHFPQLFLVVVVLLQNPHLLLVTSEPSDYYRFFYNCVKSSRSCPNGENIEYPFYDGEDLNNEYDCGYPGLSAKCSEGGRPIITLSNHSYYYQRTSGFMYFTLWDIDTADQICPQPKHNFSLDGAVASSVGMIYGFNVTLFYNCTTLPEDVSPNLPCIDQNNNNVSRHSFAIRTSRISVGFNWYANCQQKVTIPLVQAYSEMNFTKTIMAGIPLRMQPSEDCQICEESGGSCSYKRNSTSFRCSCYSKGMFDKQCPRSSKGILRKLIIGASLLATIGVSLLILFFVYKKCSKTSTLGQGINLKVNY